MKPIIIALAAIALASTAGAEETHQDLRAKMTAETLLAHAKHMGLQCVGGAWLLYNHHDQEKGISSGASCMVGCFAYADTALANSCLRGGFEFLATDPVFDKAVTGEIYIRERAND